jgi:hypothetical protein
MISTTASSAWTETSFEASKIGESETEKSEYVVSRNSVRASQSDVAGAVEAAGVSSSCAAWRNVGG